MLPRYSNTVTLILVSLFGLLLVITSVSCIFCSSLHNLWCWRRSRKMLGNPCLIWSLTDSPLQTSGRCHELAPGPPTPAPPAWTPGPWSPAHHVTRSWGPRVRGHVTSTWPPRVRLRCGEMRRKDRNGFTFRSFWRHSTMISQS